MLIDRPLKSYAMQVVAKGGRMDAGRVKLVLSSFAALLAGVALGYTLLPSPKPATKEPRKIADGALLSVRDEGQMIAFTARFVSVVTASEERLGLTARKTLIMPGAIRYRIDLARLKREDLAWDEAMRTLTVTLPALEVSLPSINPNEVQEYSEGGILMALTDSGRSLDQTNRQRGQEELMRQARAAEPMQIARTTAMRTVASSFAMPLRAAGIDASVVVRFIDPSGRETASFLNRSRRIEDALRSRRAGGK